jgi:spore coat protein A
LCIVWGSHPAVDTDLQYIFITTGNNYRVPSDIQTCLNNNQNNPSVCPNDPKNYASSIVALRIADGSVVWSYRTGADVWTSAVVPNQLIAKDFDFSQGAALFSVTVNGVTTQAVGAGQKSGIYYTVDRHTGALIWKKSSGTGNSGGGMVWGSAVDSQRIYGANANSGKTTVPMSNGSKCTTGFYFAMNKNTGDLVWLTCNPYGGQARGPVVAVTGGAVFASGMDGHFFAFDSATGAILWQFQGEGSNAAGPAITNGYMLWGSGYVRYGAGNHGNKMYCFESPARNPPGASTSPPLVTTTPAPTLAPVTTAPPALPNGYHRILPSSNNVGDFTWAPTAITIPVGDTIYWDQLASHSVYQTISADSLVNVNNGITGDGATFQVTFTAQMVQNNIAYGGNTFYFRCGPHATMYLAVTVTGVVLSTTGAPTTTPAPTFGVGYAGSCPSAGSQSKILGMRYFVDPLPIPALAQKTAASTANLDAYDISVSEFNYKVHSDIAAIKVRGYNGMYPGPTIVATKDKPVRVNWINNINAASTFMNVQTIPAGLTTTRMVTHLHGADTTVQSDGMPEEAVAAGQTFTATYANAQTPSILWYHDHAMGITRSNVYAGLAGFYLLKSASESVLNVPTGASDIPIFIQDKVLAVDANGNPYQYYPTAWSMAVYGQVMLANGKVWPYLDVTPTLYRFRIVNGNNARFMSIRFSNPNLKFIVIGNDQGYMNATLVTQALTLAPSERVDVMVNFCGYQGQDIILLNKANAPYPGDTDPLSAKVGIDPCLQGRIMLFKVRGSATCKSIPVTNIAKVEKNPVMYLTDKQAVRTRELVLVQSGAMPLQGVRNADGSISTYTYDDPATEYVKAGSVEIWKIYNLTPESHPVHIHTCSFRVLGRQKIDTTAFNNGQVKLVGSQISPNGWEAGPKDTARADPGQVLTLLVKFTANTGRFLWHCHILEHEDMHMMRPLVVQA